MSKAGKFLLLFSFLFFLVLLGARFAYGGWQSAMWVPLVLCIFLFCTAMVRDREAILAFLSMRSTKHGMNMGVLILLAIAGLVCINYLAVRYDKKFDWTKEKLNTLSDQSIKAAQGLKKDTEIVLLYRNEQAQGENIQKSVRDIVSMFQNVAPKLKFSSYSALQRPELAKKYEYSNGPFAVVAVQGDVKVKIDQPNEEGFARAFIKLGHDKKKVIYFTHGHGERDLEARDEEGLSSLKGDLDVTYESRPLTLFEVGNKVPDDAAVVAVTRPQQQFLEPELQALRDYAKRGGHLILALDPGYKQNLALLTKTFGVEFDNDYVLDLRAQVVHSGPATVLGTEFSRTNEITKAFADGSYAIFHLASSLKKAPDANSHLMIENLVQTGPPTMSIPEIKDQVSYSPNGPHTIGMYVKGSLAGEGEKDAKEFTAVIFGDSDFLANAIIHNSIDRDLALNTFSSLAQDADLLSIRPKAPAGTKLEMTTNGFLGFVFGVLLPIPLLLFISGGVVWWRRRAA